MLGAEFIAIKYGTGALSGISYKVNVLGVKVPDNSYIYGNNLSIIHNTQSPESNLKKKINEICCSSLNEYFATSKYLMAHIMSIENVSDLMTKLLCGHKWRYLVRQFLYETMRNINDFRYNFIPQYLWDFMCNRIK